MDTTLVQGTFWALGLNAGGLAIGFLTQAILAHALGVHGYGLYLTVLGWSNVAGLLCALEFTNAAVRYVSAYTAQKEWSALRGFLRRSNQIVGGTTATVSLIATVVILSLNGRLSHETEYAFLVACALFPLTSVVQLQAGVLLGWKRVQHSQAPLQVVRPALFAIGLLIVSRWLGPDFEAGDAVVVQFGATLIALTVTYMYLRRATPPEAARVQPVYHTREWVRTSSHFVAISMAQLVLSTQADLLFVSALLGTAQAGLYGAASQLATLVAFGATAILLIAQPMIADLYARKQIEELKRLAKQITILAGIASVPVFLVIMLLGHYLLRLYRPEFAAAYPVLAVLAFAQLVGATVGGLLGYLFTMTNHQQTATKIIGSTAVLNVVLALALTAWFGMLGTATATAISTIVRSGALAWAARGILREMRRNTPDAMTPAP